VFFIAAFLCSGLPSPFITFPLMIWLEERELAKRFGEEFHNYKKTVPLVLSFFSSVPAKETPGLMGSSREV